MNDQDFDESPTDWIEETIDRSATRIEEIHKSIAAIPLELMRQSDVFEQTADDVRDLQERSIGAVYELVRDVNRRVFGLASELVDLGPHTVCLMGSLDRV